MEEKVTLAGKLSDVDAMLKEQDLYYEEFNRIANVLGYEDAERFEDKNGVPVLWKMVHAEITMPLWKIAFRRIKERFFPLPEV